MCAAGYPAEYTFGAGRIMCGGRPNPIILPMIEASLDILVNRCSLEHVRRHLRRLGDHLEGHLIDRGSGSGGGEFSPIGLKMLPRDRRSCNIISLLLHPALNLSAADVVVKLKARGIVVAARQQHIRISPHVYNTTADMDELYSTVRDIVVTAGARMSLTALGEVPHRPRRKVLIVGGSGWLGQYLCKSFLHPPASSPLQDTFSPDRFELHITYNSTRPRFLPACQCHRLDLTKHLREGDIARSSADRCGASSSLCDGGRDDHCVWDVYSLVAHLQPDVLIHTAAQASPLQCERDPTTALAVNCPTALVDALQTNCPECLLLYTSTDLVYDGEHAPYPPLQPADPCLAPSTAYARTKLCFEKEVVRYSRGLVLRLSNVIGGGFVFTAPTGGGGIKFLQWIQKAFLNREKVSLKNDEVRSFVAVQDVVSLITHISHLHLSKGLGSVHPCWTQRVYNVGGAAGYSRLDFARCVAQANGSDIRLVEQMASGDESQVGPNQTLDRGGTTHSKRYWEVVSVSSASLNAPIDPVTNSCPPSSPRNVTMDHSVTTEHFGIRFVDIKESMPILIDMLL